MAQQTIVIEVPGTPISKLEQTSSVSPNDVLPVVQGEETKKAPLEQVAEMVRSGLGSAALKNESDFATPAAVAEANQSSQMRDDAQNERIDNVEHGLVSIGSGADSSFSTYAQMLAYVPAKANVSVRNNDPDPELKGVYTWTGSQYVPGYDPLDASIAYTNGKLGEVKTESKDFTKINVAELQSVAATLPYVFPSIASFGAYDTVGSLSAGQLATFVLATPAQVATTIRAVRFLATATGGDIELKVFTKTDNTFNLSRIVQTLNVKNTGLNAFILNEPFVLNANEYIGFSYNKVGSIGYVSKTQTQPSYYSNPSTSATSFSDANAGTAAIIQMAFFSESNIPQIAKNIVQIDVSTKLNSSRMDKLFESSRIGLHNTPAIQTNDMGIGQWIPNLTATSDGVVRKFRTYAQVAGIVRIGTYTKNGLIFKRNNRVDVPIVVGLNEIDINLPIKAGDYVGLQTFMAGQSRYVSQTTGHDGIYSSTGTGDEETFSATANYNYAFQFNFEISLNKPLVDTTKKWAGKDYVVCGDSIDWYDGHAYFPSHNEAGQTAIGYPSHVKAALGCNVINLAQSGWAMPQILSQQIKTYNFSNTYAISIKAGANDQKNNVKLGEVVNIGGPFNEAEYAGALQAAVEFVMNANKLTKIFLFTPIRGWYSAATANNLPTDNEFYGLRYISEKFADVVKQIGKLYGLPVIDLYNEAGFNDLNASTFYGDNQQTATELYRLHVNQLGYRRMAEVIIPEMSKY